MSAPKVDVREILQRTGADADAPEGSQAWALAQVDAIVAELIEADREFDAAADALAAAKREKGSWRTNPLGDGHPAVLRMRQAKAARIAALARIGDAA